MLRVQSILYSYAGMAQTSAGFPWNHSSQERASEQGEKMLETPVSGSNQNQATKITSSNSQSHHVRIIENKKMSSKSRKRAASVKAPQTFIPQNQEEMDERYSYGPSRHFNVRTIPPWVRDAEEDDVIDDHGDASLDSPSAALVAQHNSQPSDSIRADRQQWYPTSSGARRQDKTSRWITFGRASAYPRENFHCEKVDEEWLNENFTDYMKPWMADHEDDPDSDSNKYRALQRKRRAWYKRWQFIILRNPFVPLAFRLTVIIFAAIAIGVGASIYHEAGIIEECRSENPDNRSPYCDTAIGGGDVDYYRDPSSLMAIIVDSIAIAYTLYITYDEYFSKPLGLRPARAKIRLVLLDLFFIVFQSAILSLAFESLTVTQGACSIGATPGTSFRFDKLCNRAKALSSVLLISLVAWLMTFSISVLRLVERINAR